jgi:predicted dehydrogenase
MVPHAGSLAPEEDGVPLPPLPRPPMSSSPPRLMIIGAGSRGIAYAAAVGKSTNGLCVAVADPIIGKRRQLGRKYIWGETDPSEGQEFDDWRQFIVWEEDRRRRLASGEIVVEGIDGVFICVQDELHREVIEGLAPLRLHIMSEKPLATTLEDCLSIYDSLLSSGSGSSPASIFAVGHVLRYSPHNTLLRKLLVEQGVIGDIQSIEHTEPVGWWHFSHSYVRLVTIRTRIYICRINRTQGKLAERVNVFAFPSGQVLS